MTDQQPATGRDTGHAHEASPHAGRLVLSIANRRREGLANVHVTDEQVALVTRALADHTLIQSGLKYAPDAGPWPQATSLGRFFHHLADAFEAAAAADRPADEDTRDALAGVLAAHHYRGVLGDYEVAPFYKHFGCSCGWEQNIAGMHGWHSWRAAHEQHVRDAILAEFTVTRAGQPTDEDAAICTEEPDLPGGMPPVGSVSPFLERRLARSAGQPTEAACECEMGWQCDFCRQHCRGYNGTRAGQPTDDRVKRADERASAGRTLLGGQPTDAEGWVWSDSWVVRRGDGVVLARVDGRWFSTASGISTTDAQVDIWIEDGDAHLLAGPSGTDAAALARPADEDTREALDALLLRHQIVPARDGSLSGHVCPGCGVKTNGGPNSPDNVRHIRDAIVAEFTVTRRQA